MSALGFLDRYNFRRPHGSLGKRSPATRVNNLVGSYTQGAGRLLRSSRCKPHPRMNSRPGICTATAL
jgi:hypothetical protein